MQESHRHKHPNDFDDEINLRELFYVCWAGKWIIISVTTFISIIVVIYSLLLPNIYESRAILVPVNSYSGSGPLGDYRGLAGIAGISLPSDDDDNSEEAIKKISSLSFFKNNIMPNIFLPDLMAVESWNPKKNILTFNNSIFDTNSNTWVRDYEYPRKQIPSAQESFEIFKSRHLSIIQDKKSGFITLSIKHQSPFIAKQWVELVVTEINAFYRQKDKLESEKAVNFLNQKILMTSLSEIKEALAALLQEQTKKLTLIEVNEFYVFDYIDPPAVMEIKSEPKRFLICILGAILGGILSFLYVLIRHYFFNKKLA